MALDGRDITSVEDVLGALRDTEPGLATTVTVQRGDDRLERPLTIGAQPT